MGGGDSQCVHSLLKAWSTCDTPNSLLIINQLFGSTDSQQVWKQSCTQHQSDGKAGTSVFEELADIARVAVCSVDALDKANFARTWCLELPLAIAQYGADRQQSSTGAGRPQHVRVGGHFPDHILEMAQGYINRTVVRDPNSQHLLVMGDDEPIHMLLHLLSLSLPRGSVAEECWTSAMLVSAIILASNSRLFRDSGVWVVLLNLVGTCISRQALGQVGLQRCVLVAHLAISQIDTLLPSAQETAIALVYALHSQHDCDISLCIEDLVHACATAGGTGTATKVMAAHMVGDIAKGDSLGPLSADSVRSIKSLLGDPSDAVRKGWYIAAKRTSVYDPLRTASYGGSVSSVGRALTVSSCPVGFSSVASMLAREMTRSDALLIVRCLATDWPKQTSDDAHLAEFGLPSSVLDIAVGSLRAVMPSNSRSDVLMDIQTAVAASALALRSSSADEIGSIVALLLDALRSYLEPDSASNAFPEDIPSSTIYWILEFVYHCLVSTSHAPESLTTVDVQLLLLRAAVASSNLGFAVFICQHLTRSHRKSAKGSRKLAIYTQLLSAAPWAVVSELLGSEAGDMVDSFVEMQSLESQLGGLAVFDHDTGAIDRLKDFDLGDLGIRTGDVARTDLALLPGPVPSRSTCDFLGRSDHRLQIVDRLFDFAVADNISYVDGRGPPVLLEQEAMGKLRCSSGAATAVQIRSARWLLGRGHHQQVLEALETMDVSGFSSKHLRGWWSTFTDTLLLRASNGRTDSPVLWKDAAVRCKAIDAVRAGIPADSRIDLVFAQCPGQPAGDFVSDLVHPAYPISVDGLVAQGVDTEKARQAVLYLCSDALVADERSQLYSGSIMHGRGKIRFSAKGVLDPAAALISDVSRNPSNAPQLVADSLTTSAAKQLVPFIPQLFGLLNCRELRDPSTSMSTAADSALSILELLSESSPDVVIFHAVVADQSQASGTHGQRRTTQLLRRFSPERVADIRLFLKSAEQAMVLPQERIRWQCIKTKSAYTKALMAHLRQESSQSMVQAPLAPLYSLLDEYSARVPLSAAEKDLISVIPQLRSLVDRLAVADAGLRAAEDIWNELFMALNTPAKLATAYASPALAEFTTAIPIPSLVDSSEPRYLSHVGSSLRVIASKTRPKLLTLHLAGTTGEITKERYILKGNEDLRVDETVIQTFMRLNRVARSAEGGETEGALPLRHCAQLAVYNVVPTGLLGGLIQVVDNAPSLFFIYSQFAKAKFAPTSGPDGRNQPPTTMQIHRQCASRILKSNGVPPNTPSTKWPPELLAEVYDALVSTIPPNLLHRQVMGAALSPAHLHMASRNMVKTIAMSSMAGYILGLGDRHLDNLLVDVSRGQLVSIDFNVCFDFGGISRVPEQVPFRMTPILQYLCGSPTQSPGDASLGNWAFANSRTFARASGAALHFARMDKDALVNAIARRVQFQPFQEWGDIEMTWLKNSTRGQVHQQPSSANSPSTLDDSSSNRERWLSPDSGDASNQPSQTLPTSSLNLGSPQQAEEAIRATGLCPLSAFLPHGQTDVVCLTESSAGWRIAQAAVGRMAAKLEFRGSSVSDTCDSVVKEQVLTVWTASVAKENLMRMYAGWASWI